MSCQNPGVYMYTALKSAVTLLTSLDLCCYWSLHNQYYLDILEFVKGTGQA